MVNKCWAVTCQRGKVCNPASGRCVDKKGSVGKKLVSKSGQKASKKASKKASRKASKKAFHKASKKASRKGSKAGKKGKIFNSATNRWINDTPANRKKLGMTAKSSRKASRKSSRKASRKSSRKASRKSSRKASKKSSKKASRKASKKASRKASKKASRKASKKASKNVKKANDIYSGMKLPEIKALAKKAKITGFSTMKKADLIKVLMKKTKLNSTTILDYDDLDSDDDFDLPYDRKMGLVKRTK